MSLLLHTLLVGKEYDFPELRHVPRTPVTHLLVSAKRVIALRGFDSSRVKVWFTLDCSAVRRGGKRVEEDEELIATVRAVWELLEIETSQR